MTDQDLDRLREIAAIHAWIRDDAPVTIKMVITPKLIAALTERLDAARAEGAPPPSSHHPTHAFEPHPKFPWFCDKCGYAPHEVLMHGQDGSASGDGGDGVPVRSLSVHETDKSDRAEGVAALQQASGNCQEILDGSVIQDSGRTEQAGEPVRADAATEQETQDCKDWLSRLLDGVVNANRRAEQVAMLAYREFGK